ncbi:MAG: hypothetical protein K5669_00590 [Lachnospiraceae bacterium]|nr:hypothetical protein [Lachnospiraceae bacterium]
MKKEIVIIIIIAVVVLLILASAFIHRRVIRALIKGEPMPKAPSWHIWVPKDKRR